MTFWKENIDRIIEFNDKKLLRGKGKISNDQMEQQVEEIYNKFDAKRKIVESQLADDQDMEELRLLGEEINKLNKHP